MNRREFFSQMARLTALSVATLEALNAAAYEQITDLGDRYPLDASPDGVYWEAVRDQFLFAHDQIMMNDGTVGPMPKPVARTLARHFKTHCTNPFAVYTLFPMPSRAAPQDGHRSPTAAGRRRSQGCPPLWRRR